MTFRSTGWARKHYHRWGQVQWVTIKGRQTKQQYCKGCGQPRYPDV